MRAVRMTALFFIAILVSLPLPPPLRAEEEGVILTVLGRVVNAQGRPVPEAKVRVFIAGELYPLNFGAETAADGSYLAELRLPHPLLEKIKKGGAELTLEVSKPAFRTVRRVIEKGNLKGENNYFYAHTGNITLLYAYNYAFFIATGTFLLVFALISFNVLHETIASFLGTALMFGVTYALGSFFPDFWIISFERSLEYIEFDTIFLLMGMMIFMAIMGQTGVFSWLAFKSYQVACGEAALLAAILLLVTGLISAVLNNTTAMLLMVPLSVEIALMIGVHPFSLVFPEVLASNIGGAATLIGDPPNTIIGTSVGLSFNQFLAHTAPVAFAMLAVLILVTRWIYRGEYRRERAAISPVLLERLERDAQITDFGLLRKSLLVFASTMALFFLADFFQMPPSVVAILGASVLLLWVRPSIGEIMKEVDWTTLVFFMTLFIMVGGVQEVGFIQAVADSIRNLAGENLLLATMLILWFAGAASGVVANIPLTAAILPITTFLSENIPGAENNVLYWALAIGACFGGNATYFAAAPNIVAVGILERAGYRPSFADFAKIGVLVTFVTLLLPAIWFIIRYFWLKI